MPTRFSTRKTGSRWLKGLKQCLEKITSIEKHRSGATKPTTEPKNSTLMTNLKRAFQSSPHLVNNNKFMSSTSTLSSHLPSLTKSSLESSQTSYTTSLNSHESASTTIVLFEPVRVRKPFIFPIRNNTSELAFPLPLHKSRSSCENMIQSPPLLLPIITLTSPSDDHNYALFCPKALDPNLQSLRVPVRASRNWPHPSGPWLRTVGDAYLRTPDETLRLSGDALVGWPVSRSLPPRLMTDAEREALMLVEKIKRDLEIAQHAFRSHFDQPWVPEFSEEILDDEEEESDEEEQVGFLYRNHNTQSNSVVNHNLFSSTTTTTTTNSEHEDDKFETIEMIE